MAIGGCSGRALGVFDDANLTDQEIHLAPGDTLLLYTDGVTEARAPDGTFFGEERLASLLRSSVGLDATTLAGRRFAYLLTSSASYDHDRQRDACSYRNRPSIAAKRLGLSI